MSTSDADGEVGVASVGDDKSEHNDDVNDSDEDDDDDDDNDNLQQKYKCQSAWCGRSNFDYTIHKVISTINCYERLLPSENGKVAA